MEFLVLGTLEVLAGGERLDLGSQRQRTVLAALTLDANRAVRLDRLVEALYGEDPPSTARVQVQICVSALRRLFAGHGQPAAIVTEAHGYRLRLDDDQLDLHRFEAALREARRLRDLRRVEEAVARYREAAALWRGPAFDGVDSRLVESAAARLAERRCTAVEECVELELGLGRHRELIDELTALVAEQPLRSRLLGQLMLALYRSGRQPEALDAYRAARRHLVEELGLEPGEDLRRLEHAILTGDPQLSLPSPEQGGEPPLPAPHLLPTDIADFTGRSAQLDAIERQLTLAAQDASRFAVPVVVMPGKPGVGKTTLAVHAAHRLAARYPDGQLFADLHGRNSGQVSAMQVLERFLRALGVPGAQIPTTLDECAERYRALLSNRRMLVVLDNASSESQVRPLVPGTSRSAVMVTSRGRLAGLPGAVHVDIDVFDAAHSVQLLSRVVGADRIEAESASTAQLAELCGHLPLALRIAGARLAARPHWSVDQLLQRLVIETRRLDELKHSGLGVRASIALTYDHLAPDAQRLLRLLTVPEVPHFSGWVAAALLDTALPDAQDLLDELADAQLVETSGSSRGESTRYRLHDLIRVFARERLLQDETAAARDAALGRYLGALLLLAGAAHDAMYGGDFLRFRSPAALYPLPPAQVRRLVDPPLPWFERERPVLVAAVRHAAAAGLVEHCWGLARTAVTLFESRNYLGDWRETHRVALAAATEAGDERGQAATLYSIGSLRIVERRFDEALDALEAARTRLERLGDEQGVALVEGHIAFVDRMHGRYAEATERYLRILTTFRRNEDLVAAAYTLQNLAQIKLEQGDLEAARTLLPEALQAIRRAGSARVEAQVLHRLGELHLQAQEPQAAYVFEQALAVVRELGDPVGEAYALLGVGTAGLRGGDLAGAAAALRDARRLARDLGERLVEARVCMVLGELAAGEDPALAVTEWRRALELLQVIRAPALEAQVMALLAEVDPG
ncbi:BTAD domain-containing putative transcriptional regulator [Dactylosporangium sp. NPDC049525]|uniref:AfsR/SARP family transcriptional regulator n=1 Tax=Dactylosporangium sp. NPDC049525 TaxID=3154730 RepID=UPI00341B0A99